MKKGLVASRLLSYAPRTSSRRWTSVTDEFIKRLRGVFLSRLGCLWSTSRHKLWDMECERWNHQCKKNQEYGNYSQDNCGDVDARIIKPHFAAVPCCQVVLCYDDNEKRGGGDKNDKDTQKNAQGLVPFLVLSVVQVLTQLNTILVTVIAQVSFFYAGERGYFSAIPAESKASATRWAKSLLNSLYGLFMIRDSTLWCRLSRISLLSVGYNVKLFSSLGLANTPSLETSSNRSSIVACFPVLVRGTIITPRCHGPLGGRTW